LRNGEEEGRKETKGASLASASRQAAEGKKGKGNGRGAASAGGEEGKRERETSERKREEKPAPLLPVLLEKGKRKRGGTEKKKKHGPALLRARLTLGEKKIEKVEKATPMRCACSPTTGREKEERRPHPLRLQGGGGGGGGGGGLGKRGSIVAVRSLRAFIFSSSPAGRKRGKRGKEVKKKKRAAALSVTDLGREEEEREGKRCI